MRSSLLEVLQEGFDALRFAGDLTHVWGALRLMRSDLRKLFQGGFRRAPICGRFYDALRFAGG